MCPEIVAPFSLAENGRVLSELGMSGIFEAVKMLFDSWVQGASASVKDTAATAKHNIPYQLRAKAVQLNWLPMEAEVEIGNVVLETLRQTGGIEDEETKAGKKYYPLARALLDSTLNGVKSPFEYKFRIYVSSSESENAMALPGGIIVIDRALLTPERAKKGKFAVAHEVGHVLRRHETRAVQARIIDAVSVRTDLTNLTRVIGEAKSNPSALLALYIDKKLKWERFYVDQELSSDSCAARILTNEVGGKDTVPILNAFLQSLPKPNKPESSSARPAALADRNRDLEGIIEVVSRPVERHPTASERTENLRAIVKELTSRSTNSPSAKAARKVPNAASAAGPPQQSR